MVAVWQGWGVVEVRGWGGRVAAALVAGQGLVSLSPFLGASGQLLGHNEMIKSWALGLPVASDLCT